MKRTGLMLLMLLLLASAGKAQSLEEGIRHLRNENFAAAKQTFEAIAKNEPKNGAVHFYLGEIEYLSDNTKGAEEHYKKGLVANPTCAECKVGLGKLELDKEKPADAEEHFQTALKLDKKSAEIPYLIGESYLRSKKPNANKAVEYLYKASGMSGEKDPRILSSLGEAYRLTGDNGSAMTSFENAVRVDPTNTSAYIQMARIWSAAQQDSLAIQQLEAARAQSPDDALVYKDLIEQYIHVRGFEKVTPLLEKYVSLTGNDPDAKVRLVKFLTFQAKDYDRAAQMGEDVLVTNPEQYTVHRWLAWSYAEKENWQASLDHSEKLFRALNADKSRKAFPSDYEYYAEAAVALDNLDKAIEVYNEYLVLEPSKAEEIYGMISKKYFDARNYTESAKYYMLKDSVKTLNQYDRYYLGLALYYSDQDTLADTAFAQLIAENYNTANSYLMRARIAERKDTTGTQFLAVPYYMKYVELTDDPTKDLEKVKRNLIVAYHTIAYYEVQMDKLADAKTRYKRILELDPENADALNFLKILEGSR